MLQEEHVVTSRYTSGSSSPMATLEWLGRSVAMAALRLCVPAETINDIERKHVRDSGGAHLICYLDGVSDELVKRQLEFRRSRKLERSSISISSSLDIVSEDSVLHGDSLRPATLRREKSAPAEEGLTPANFSPSSVVVGPMALFRSRWTDCSWLDAGDVLYPRRRDCDSPSLQRNAVGIASWILDQSVLGPG